LGLLLLLAVSAPAQQGAPPTAPPLVAPAATDFERTADEVLTEVSRLIELPVKAPLKKSIRTREEIRAFVTKEMDAEREPAKRYADLRALERFGLLPKGFDLDAFILDLLTEQIAGLYDPKQREFFIASWIKVDDEQRVVMAHELVHALHDQHFGLEQWIRAAKPNDDALLARDAVVEGAAIGGMMDYMLREMNLKVRDMPDLANIMERQLGASLGESPQLASAPMYIRDAIMFPYFAGAVFTQQVLKAGSGWAEFHKRVFETPPVSTQQILHPELYITGVTPRPVSLPDLSRALPRGWKKLDENLIGEFGLRSLLKQFLGEKRALTHSPAWAGDRYAIYEQEKTKETALVFRLRLESVEAAAFYFGQYSDLLEVKYEKRAKLLRRRNFFSFETPEGSVFLYCVADQCLTTEGFSRAVFDRAVRAMNWPAAPTAPARTPAKIAAVRFSFPNPRISQEALSLR
jgi:hypothetical protein